MKEIKAYKGLKKEGSEEGRKEGRKGGREKKVGVSNNSFISFDIDNSIRESAMHLDHLEHVIEVLHELLIGDLPVVVCVS